MVQLCSYYKVQINNYKTIILCKNSCAQVFCILAGREIRRVCINIQIERVRTREREGAEVRRGGREKEREEERTKEELILYN